MTDETQLERLREQSRTTNIAIGKSRDEVVRCIRESGEVRIAAALEPESSSPKEIEARCKKLDTQRNAAQAEIDRLMTDVEAFDTAIQRIETDLLPKLHAGRLEKQRNVQESYRNVARRMLDAANLMAELSLEASAIFRGAQRDFPKEESAADQDLIRFCAGLMAVWDHEWIDRYGHPTRRDMIVGAVFDWDRTIVDEADPVAKLKRRQEDYQRKRYEEIERERQVRFNPTHADIERSRAEAHARGESTQTAQHPLAPAGQWRF